MNHEIDLDDQIAKLFIKTVQGDYSKISCTIINNKLTTSDKPVRWHAKPDLGLLVQYLRTDSVLLDPIEHWIVNIFKQDDAVFDKYGELICRVREISRRKAGRPWNPSFPTWIDSLPPERLCQNGCVMVDGGVLI